MASQFKQAFPANYQAYKQACDRDEVRPGAMFVWDSKRRGPRRYIINFPTKRHWRSKLKLEYIDTGLHDLVRAITELDITSIAVPALGCGNGGLEWDDVRVHKWNARKQATFPVGHVTKAWQRLHDLGWFTSNTATSG